MNWLAGACVGVTFVCAIGSWLLNSRNAFDAISFLHYYFIAVFVVRPTLILTRLTTFYPEYLFPEIPETIFHSQCVALLWIICIGIALLALRRSPNPLTVIFPKDRSLDLNKSIIALTLISTCTGVLMAWLLLKYGGLNGVLVAAKLEKSLASTFALRQFPAMGLFLSVAMIGQLLRGARPNVTFWTSLPIVICLAVINGMAYYLWGAREGIVIMACALLYFLSAKWVDSAYHIRWTRVIVGVIAIVCLSTVAYTQRLQGLGATKKAISTQTLLSTISVSFHLTRYDAFCLLVRDWDSRNDLRLGKDIALGNLSAVPRAIWRSKPDVVLPGAWFRQRYEPERINGWPFSEIGEWYISFGIAGVFLGAVIAAVIFDAIAKRYDIRSGNSFGICVSTVLACSVVQGGSVLQFTPEYVLNVVPIFAIGLLCGAPAEPADIND